MKQFSSILFVAVLLCGAGGCQETGTKGKQTEAIPTRIDDVLTSGDVLRIAFSGAPELSQTQRIRGDGKISLPKVGDVQAAGETPSSLQTQLVALYKSSLQNSEVTVILETSSFPVIILGAVNHPGEVNLTKPSLLQAIGKAGGVTRGLGDASRIRIIHEGEDRNTARVVNLQAILSGRSQTIIYLQRGDTVIVPEKWL